MRYRRQTDAVLQQRHTRYYTVGQKLNCEQRPPRFTNHDPCAWILPRDVI